MADQAKVSGNISDVKMSEEVESIDKSQENDSETNVIADQARESPKPTSEDPDVKLSECSDEKSTPEEESEGDSEYKFTFNKDLKEETEDKYKVRDIKGFMKKSLLVSEPSESSESNITEKETIPEYSEENVSDDNTRKQDDNTREAEEKVESKCTMIEGGNDNMNNNKDKSERVEAKEYGEKDYAVIRGTNDDISISETSLIRSDTTTEEDVVVANQATTEIINIEDTKIEKELNERTKKFDGDSSISKYEELELKDPDNKNINITSTQLEVDEPEDMIQQVEETDSKAESHTIDTDKPVTSLDIIEDKSDNNQLTVHNDQHDNDNIDTQNVTVDVVVIEDDDTMQLDENLESENVKEDDTEGEREPVRIFSNISIICPDSGDSQDKSTTEQESDHEDAERMEVRDNIQSSTIPEENKSSGDKEEAGIPQIELPEVVILSEDSSNEEVRTVSSTKGIEETKKVSAEMTISIIEIDSDREIEQEHEGDKASNSVKKEEKSMDVVIERERGGVDLHEQDSTAGESVGPKNKTEINTKKDDEGSSNIEKMDVTDEQNVNEYFKFKDNIITLEEDYNKDSNQIATIDTSKDETSESKKCEAVSIGNTSRVSAQEPDLTTVGKVVAPFGPKNSDKPPDPEVNSPENDEDTPRESDTDNTDEEKYSDRVSNKEEEGSLKNYKLRIRIDKESYSIIREKEEPKKPCNIMSTSQSFCQESDLKCEYNGLHYSKEVVQSINKEVDETTVNTNDPMISKEDSGTAAEMKSELIKLQNSDEEIGGGNYSSEISTRRKESRDDFSIKGEVSLYDEKSCAATGICGEEADQDVKVPDNEENSRGVKSDPADQILRDTPTSLSEEDGNDEFHDAQEFTSELPLQQPLIKLKPTASLLIPIIDLTLDEDNPQPGPSGINLKKPQDESRLMVPDDSPSDEETEEEYQEAMDFTSGDDSKSSGKRKASKVQKGEEGGAEQEGNTNIRKFEEEVENEEKIVKKIKLDEPDE